MKGYTIQHSIELLEKQPSSGSGASTAAQVSFNNTGTGLVATNVQGALSEIVGRLNFSTTETKIGTYAGADLFAKILVIDNQASSKSIDYDVSALAIDNLIYVGGSGLPAIASTADYSKYLFFGNNTLQIRIGNELTAPTSISLLAIYTKVASESKKTTKKK